MSVLSRVQTGKQTLPPRIVLYGTEGIGKSTFASQAPNPIFIQTEDGLGQIECHRFDQAMALSDVTGSLDELLKKEHEYRTVVIDSLDWMERLIHDEMCRMSNVTSIEKVDGGYGKGYINALTPLRYVLSQLNSLRDKKGMMVICLAHSKSEKVEDPETGTYHQYSPRLHKLATALVCEWADAVLFAQQKKRIQTESSGYNKSRNIATALGSDGGERVIRTIGSPSCIAKNRYGLPFELPLGWDAFIGAMK